MKRRSSVGMAIRALVMLACVVGIPAAAISGTSWSEIVKKFQGLRLPAVLSWAQASDSHATDDAPATAVKAAGPKSASPRALRADPSPPPDPSAALNQKSRRIQDRLRRLGATYYVLEVLEAWGQQPSVYRFFCKMAIHGNAECTRCFEATGGEPLQAMTEVLEQVERWRGQ